MTLPDGILLQTRRKDNPMTETYHTIEEISELMKVSRQTVHRWLTQGILGSVKIGKVRRIPSSALQKMIDEGHARAQRDHENDDT
jgi:excisionase family DNA binding protein